MVQGMPGIQAGRNIEHCEHVTSGEHSLLWWEECPKCKGGAYIVHRCLECGEEYKQGEEGVHAHWADAPEKDPDLAAFVELSQLVDENSDVQAWKNVCTSAVYKRVASVYEKSDLFKLFMKARNSHGT